MKPEKYRFFHKRNPDSSVFGQALETGDTLLPTDRYESSSGLWELCPTPGLVLQEGINTRWVRPTQK